MRDINTITCSLSRCEYAELFKLSEKYGYESPDECFKDLIKSGGIPSVRRHLRHFFVINRAAQKLLKHYAGVL